MLKHLTIKNVAVIDEVNIDFEPGFCVLTGETGAGKSIIIDSINLLKGDRGSKSIIRSGTDRACVSAVFEPEDEVRDEIADITGSEIDDELIISRTLSQDGKNTIRINGMPANLAMLKSVGELLINIHGQHDNTSLLSEKTHIAFLDGYGREKTATILNEYKALFDKCKQISEEIESIDTDEQEKLRRMDMLRFQTAELEEASLEIGEDEQLMARKTLIDNAMRISENTRRAYDSLYGGENGTAHDLMWEALGYLEKIAPFDAGISSIYDDISDIAESLDEKVRELRLASENMNFDESEADSIEERLELIQNLKRKYGPTIEAILEFYQNALSELHTIETSSERLEELKEELEANKKLLRQKADALHKVRCDFAKKLCEGVMRELSDLNMAKVEFACQFSPTSGFKPNGTDEVRFTVRTNVGEEMKPLAKIASGGELSRIMLAIKNVIRDSDKVKSAVFDEIDTGVSGSAAQKIGEKLLEMSKGNLVLCITHLPQIAALADYHYLIEKQVENERTSTKVKLLSFDERVDEIARTLGGASVTDITRENARQLLCQAKS